jgi:hypothetical protein
VTDPEGLRMQKRVTKEIERWKARRQTARETFIKGICPEDLDFGIGITIQMLERIQHGEEIEKTLQVLAVLKKQYENEDWIERKRAIASAEQAIAALLR